MKLPNDDLKNIPGIGKRIQQHLANIGIHTTDDLKGQNAEDLYMRDTLYKGFEDDRCLLYVYRLAVDYANDDRLDKHTLKWWDYKD